MFYSCDPDDREITTETYRFTGQSGDLLALWEDLQDLCRKWDVDMDEVYD